MKIIHKYVLYLDMVSKTRAKKCVDYFTIYYSVMESDTTLLYHIWNKYPKEHCIEKVDSFCVRE